MIWRAIIVSAAVALVTDPAWAQSQAESDLLKGIWGVSISLALLVLLTAGVIRFGLADRNRLLTAIEKRDERIAKLEAEKLELVRELVPLARENADAFKDAKIVMETIHNFVKAADARNLQLLTGAKT